MYMQTYLLTAAILVFLCSFVPPSFSFSDEKLGAIQRLVALGDMENEDETGEPEISGAFLGDPGRKYRPSTLIDILNTRVKSKNELCSSENVRQFLQSGSLGYLIKCKNALGQRRNNSSQINNQKDTRSSTQFSKVMESYSGKLLKRLFENGMPKFHIEAMPRAEGSVVDVNGDVVSEKRSRLSINGALGSLVDMLHQESRKHRRPVYAFHRELLHLG